jgi:hypothetical protein
MYEEHRIKISSLLGQSVSSDVLAYLYYHHILHSSNADDQTWSMTKRLLGFSIETCKELIDLLRNYFATALRSKFIDELLDVWLLERGKSLDRDGIFAITDLMDVGSIGRYCLITAVRFCAWDGVRDDQWDHHLPLKLIYDRLKQRGYMDPITAILYNIRSGWYWSPTNFSVLMNWIEEYGRTSTSNIVTKGIFVSMPKLNEGAIGAIVDMFRRVWTKRGMERLIIYCCKWSKKYLLSRLTVVCGRQIVDAICAQQSTYRPCSFSRRLDEDGLLDEWMGVYDRRVESLVSLFVEPSIDLPRDLALLSIQYL